MANGKKKKQVTNYFDGATLTDEGLNFKGNIMSPVVEQCEGCDRVTPYEGASYCTSYAQPERKWSKGTCNFATHANTQKAGDKAKVNPLKASKRAARGR